MLCPGRSGDCAAQHEVCEEDGESGDLSGKGRRRDGEAEQKKVVVTLSRLSGKMGSFRDLCNHPRYHPTPDLVHCTRDTAYCTRNLVSQSEIM